MNLATIRRLVYRHLAEANIGNDRITASDIDSIVGVGYELLTAETKACVTSIDTTLDNSGTVKGLKILSSLSLAGAKAIGVRRATDTTAGVTLNKTTTQVLDVMYPGWRSDSTGTPVYCFMYDSNTLGVYPYTAHNILLEVAVIPAPMSGDTDEPDIPPQFHMALVWFAVEHLTSGFLATGDAASSKMQEAKAKYENIVKEMMEYAATGVGLHPIKLSGA